jgi:hypothetical protein
MKRLISIVIVLALAVYAFRKHRDDTHSEAFARTAEASQLEDRPRPQPNSPLASRFRCDGRTRCSQMTSCEEATFFLRNCPDVKMDGEGDGIPCESQWCGVH